MFVAFAVGCFTMGHFAGAARNDEGTLEAKKILAESFELRDSDGNLCAWLYRGAKGEVLLTFYDNAKHPRLSMGLDEKGMPGVSFLGASSNVKMKWSTSPGADTPSLDLYDEHGNPAISIGIGKQSVPALIVGSPGKPRVAVAVSEDGSPSIQLMDSKNRSRMELQVTADQPVVTLKDEKQSVRASWRLEADGEPVLSLSDSNANQRLVVKTDKQGNPSIRFLDADKNLGREIK